MSVVVGVDLDSAVVAYRPAAGEERSSPVSKASVSELLHASPWRTFRWHYGQRHYSGTYWSSTERDHVIYESRLELANLILADFDPRVRQIKAQPFIFVVEAEGRVRRHIVDYLWATAEGPEVVDVVRAERMSDAKIQFLQAWTQQVVEFMGWTYRVVNEPDPIRLGNLRFLAGYRREWLMRQEILGEIRSAPERFAGRTLAECELELAEYPKQFVRPALMHLLWSHEFGADLDRPIGPTSVLEALR